MVLTRGTQELTDITLKDITGPLPATAGPGQGNAMQPSEALIPTQSAVDAGTQITWPVNSG